MAAPSASRCNQCPSVLMRDRDLRVNPQGAAGRAGDLEPATYRGVASIGMEHRFPARRHHSDFGTAAA
jgi:hypothetical protein